MHRGRSKERRFGPILVSWKRIDEYKFRGKNDDTLPYEKCYKTFVGSATDAIDRLLYHRYRPMDLCSQSSISHFASHCRKGGTDALDYFCNPTGTVASVIGERLYDGWLRSCPAGHRHHRACRSAHSGTKSAVATRSLGGR